uniref:Uncharacterized protein n=1 Tax=Alexandrium monilatum TaxID=311494 RepID=A0A6T1E8M4_9DINO
MRVSDEDSDSSHLSVPLMQEAHPKSSLRGQGQLSARFVDELCDCCRRMFRATTDAAFIRSEVNGRGSRRIVLFAFFCTDVIGAILWASWCQRYWGERARSPEDESHQACSSFGINHFVLLALSMPVEGAALFLSGWTPWSFWSDGLLLPVWLIRLVLFDVLLWDVSPETLVVDALWFSIMAVMCRVHSLAFTFLVVSQVISLQLVFRWHGAWYLNDVDDVRYGIFSVIMLVIMAGTYALDEQSRLHSHSKLMSLQDQNAQLAESMLRWKVLAEAGSAAGPPQPPGDFGVQAHSGGPPAGQGRHAGSPGPGRLVDIAVGAWSRLTTKAEHPGVTSQHAAAARAHDRESACSREASEVTSSDPDGLVSFDRTHGKRRARQPRTVRFDLPQAARNVVPTRKPSAGIGISIVPSMHMDLRDVME